MALAGDMTGKAVLVTGAASGLGKAAALALAKAGADVAMADLNPTTLALAADEARAVGVKVLALPADVSSPEACRALVEQTVAAFGRLDALCNVAGVLVFAHSHEMSLADWDRTLAVNLSGPFHLMQAAIPHLLETNGAIVNVTSQAAFLGQSYSTAYSASKAALTHLTRAMAVEYSHKPIRINAVAPGGMMTPLATQVTFPPDTDYSLIQRYSGLRGMVEVGDVAEMVAYLASPAARGMNGACINFDAGASAG
jgi:NAD(P)-dependent dehydrogenase (short-subunit alcohol dehydrogenase family)